MTWLICPLRVCSSAMTEAIPDQGLLESVYSNLALVTFYCLSRRLLSVTIPRVKLVSTYIGRQCVTMARFCHLNITILPFTAPPPLGYWSVHTWAFVFALFSNDAVANNLGLSDYYCIAAVSQLLFVVATLVLVSTDRRLRWWWWWWWWY